MVLHVPDAYQFYLGRGVPIRVHGLLTEPDPQIELISPDPPPDFPKEPVEAVLSGAIDADVLLVGDGAVGAARVAEEVGAEILVDVAAQGRACPVVLVVLLGQALAVAEPGAGDPVESLGARLPDDALSATHEQE